MVTGSGRPASCARSSSREFTDICGSSATDRDLDASAAAALVAAVENYRATTCVGLLAVGHDHILLNRWCDRTVRWEASRREAPPSPRSGSAWSGAALSVTGSYSADGTTWTTVGTATLTGANSTLDAGVFSTAHAGSIGTASFSQFSVS
ncbi:hypothetical protein SGFS_078920 [Streptomyces graminofaciens]|uniref:Uncharacterized protein n=1 Tax=Streptomyces graminofaciens TaxID=68212 RepID=A0ABM7FK14_9ACTN|nr:hypothetical protein SGFS_078920 [Streptomyces graminofaciens]